MIKPFSKGLRESRGEQPLAATAVAESLRRTPSRRPTDNAKRSAGRGEKTVRWTVFSRGDPRRGSPRFAEQGEANKKTILIPNAEHKYPVFCLSHPLPPLPRKGRGGLHPVTRPFTLRRTARPLPSRGGVCSQRYPAESKPARHFRCGGCQYADSACIKPAGAK